MADFFKYILVYCIFISSSGFVFADPADINNQLSQLIKSTDKKQALKDVNQLLLNPDMTPLQYIKALNLGSQFHHSLGDLDNAIKLTRQTQLYAHTKDLKKEEAEAFKRLGVLHYFKGDNPTSLTNYQTALEFYDTLDEPIKRAHLLNNIGLVYAAMEDISQALQSYQRAEPIYQNLGSEQDQIDIRFNIAGLYNRLGRFDVAINMYLQVIKDRKRINDTSGVALAYGDLGIAYKKSSQHEKAKHYLLAALTYYQAQKDQYNQASQLHNLSDLFIETDEIEKGIEYAKESIALSVKQQHQNAYVGSLYSLAKALFRKGEYEESKIYLKQSSDVAVTMADHQQLNENIALLSLIYAAQNDTKQALSSHFKYLSAANMSSNKALNLQLAKYRALLESEKLKRQVEKLEQNKLLQNLAMAQAAQKRNFAIIAGFLLLLAGFFVYRRNVERSSKEELEVKVKQRTQELETLMLELQKANEIKGQFLANMSHEIRTPLTSIIGQAEAIINGDVEEAYLHKEIEIIHNNSEHLLRLINNVLDLSKIGVNKLELEYKTQDLHSVLNDLNHMFTDTAKKKGLIFSISHCLPTPFFVQLDIFRVKQILINLCSNAIKFTDHGHIKIDIVTRKSELVFKVSDTGIGMSETQVQQIFKSFTQADNSISRRFGGSGLGLCLSEQLAILLGGTINVESEIGQGSIFSFILPCEQIQDYRLEDNNEATQIEFEQISGQILLAEDHNDNRRLISRLLTGLGLEVITAKNGKEAVELLLQYEPQLILLDIQMPEMDGIEAFKLLRQCGCNQPVIALTANAMSHEIAHYLELGFDGHLKKPIERQHFISTIIQYYKNMPQASELDDTLKSIDMSDLQSDFKNSLGTELKALSQSYQSQDFVHLEKQAHRLAGAADIFDFKDIAMQAKLIEKAIKSNEVANIDNMVEKLFSLLEVQILETSPG